MIKGLKILISIIFWLQAFVAPVILSGLIWLSTGSEKLFIPLMIAGGVIGIIVAEYIRKRIGLDVFFGRIYGPNQMDEKWEKKNQKGLKP
jgi:hypothetical protein